MDDGEGVDKDVGDSAELRAQEQWGAKGKNKHENAHTKEGGTRLPTEDERRTPMTNSEKTMA